MKGSIATVLAAASFAFEAAAYGQLKYAEMTGNCKTQGPANGTAVYCCSGECLDRTTIFSTTGQCKDMLNMCEDLPSAPSCAANQILVKDPRAAEVDSGDGKCAFIGNCSWKRTSWSWSCCDCPASYRAIPAACGEQIPAAPCVACADPSQELIGDTLVGFSCVSKPPPAAEEPSNKCKPDGETCDFYRCLDRNRDGCGEAWLPLGRAHQECRSLETTAHMFSPQGRQWIADAQLCLQRALIPKSPLLSMSSPSFVAATTCPQIRVEGFGEGRACHVAEGLCTLPPADWDALAFAVGPEVFAAHTAEWRRAADADPACARPRGFADWLDRVEAEQLLSTAPAGAGDVGGGGGGGRLGGALRPPRRYRPAHDLPARLQANLGRPRGQRHAHEAATDDGKWPQGL